MNYSVDSCFTATNNKPEKSYIIIPKLSSLKNLQGEIFILDYDHYVIIPDDVAFNFGSGKLCNVCVFNENTTYNNSIKCGLDLVIINNVKFNCTGINVRLGPNVKLYVWRPSYLNIDSNNNLILTVPEEWG